MLFRDLFEEDIFAEVFQEIEEFAKIKLKSYNDKIEDDIGNEYEKEIFDAVWGNVEFSKGEVIILDSPLLQRLRKVKQLGLAYFVYCGSDYSRFYHTIGVAFLGNRMAATINKCEIGIGEKEKCYFKAVVRLAAIFHDVGHMFLSHVSEHYFGKSPLYYRYETIRKMLDQFERIACKNISLHELLSCMIVNSKETKRLLRTATKYIDDIDIKKEDDINRLVDYISSFIVGVPIDKRSLPFASIINGPIDADKCDYLSRDSHVSRVPVAVDISRITHKLSIVKSENINKSELWNDNELGGEFYELAMKDSAEKSLFQLCIARTIMFDSVYYHHKVLTAETEFRNILNTLSHLEKPIFQTFTEILSYTDEDFNKYFFETLKTNRNEADICCINKAYERVEYLYNRELAKRIICLMPDYLMGSQSDKEFLYDTVLTSMSSEEESNLIDEIKAEYINICSLLDIKVTEKDDINIFFIKSPTNVFGHSKIHIPIDLRNGNKREFQGYNLVSSRETSSSASYIVTGENEKLLVYLALEKVFLTKYKIGIKSESISCGKFNQEDINKKCKMLFKKGYYNNAPILVRESLLDNYISRSDIKGIVDKFATYEGVKGYKLTNETVEYFFKQILCICKDKKDCKELVKGILELLEQALFIDRKYITNNFELKLNEIDSKDSIKYIIPMGNMRDSAKHMTYYWNDIQSKKYKIETEKSLVEILELEEKCNEIIFFDDGSFSGSQMISIMQEYMGIEKRKTNEKHVEMLSEKLQYSLRNRNVVFFFLAFNKNKEKEMKTELAELGFNRVKFIYCKDMSNKLLEKSIVFKDYKREKIVKDNLFYIGHNLMLSSKKHQGENKLGWSDTRIKNSSLGYNDAQQMVILKSSVPTYTITAFWQEGQVDGIDWKPLFRRTKK